MNKPIYNDIESFITRTGDVIYLREHDSLLIIRPNKIQHLNKTAFEILNSLYILKIKPGTAVKELSAKYGIKEEEIRTDMVSLLKNIDSIMNEDYSRADMIETIPFDPGSIKYPVISEIALTYRCQNRCDFCYASSPIRGDERSEMSTDDVKLVIDKIKNEAHVPTISFTGGEPTLRGDLPHLIKYAHSLGLRTNLITNGIRCEDEEYVKELKEAGLNSAQVSLESHSEDLHNSITGNCNSFRKTVRGIHNLKNSGIYTHTNSTICEKNRERLTALADFIKEKFDFPYLSMNMIIKTGTANTNDNVRVTYTSIKDILEPLIGHCERIGIKFVWYSPTPYCIFNPVDHSLGSKSCACISGLLSVSPTGQVLPCSSYDRGVGSLLKRPFDYIWNSDEAIYFRERRYLPPVCKKCEYELLCAGACPLYWEKACSFSEIEEVNNRKPKIKNFLWKLEKKLRVKARGTEES